MLSSRKLDEITRNLSKGKRRASNLGTIYAIYNNFVDVRMGNSPTLLKNVTVQGDSDTLYVGQKVRVEWSEKDGSPGEAPFVAGGSGDFLSGMGGSSTVIVDDVTITKGFVGLSVKKAGIGTQHLNFLPAMDGHTHESKLEQGGWQFTDDGIMYTDKMYIHPQGMIKVGGNRLTYDDVIVLDSNDATYRLWAGDQVAADAPFSVSKAGAIKATSGLIGGWSISSTEISGGGIEISSLGYIQSNPFTSGLVGFRIDDDVAEFNNVRVRGEIHASVFVYDEIHAVSGAFGVFYSAGVLLNECTTLSSPTMFWVDIKDPDTGHVQLFEANDVLRIKDGSGKDNWMHVDTVSNQSTFFRYGCILESGTPGVFAPGAAVVDYGLSGQGFIIMTAYDGTSGSDANLTMATHAGSPWSSQTVQLRLGNLNGSYGMSSDVYGIGIGDINGNYMRYDSVSGQLVISGSVVIGSGIGFVTEALIQCPYDGPKPFASNFAVDTTGHLGQVGTIYGGVRGEAGKFHKSVALAPTATNLVGNPVADSGTGWWGTVSVGTTRSTDFAKYGTACYKLVDDTTSWVFLLTPNLTVTASTQYTGSFWFHDGDGNWVRRIDSITTQVGATWMNFGVFRRESDHDLFVRYYSNIGTILETEIDQGSAATAFYVDGFQLEQTVHETPFFHGSMGSGFAWTGTAHASNSTRAKAYLSYPANENYDRSRGSMSCWVYYPGHHNWDYPRIFQYYEDSSNQMILLFQNTGNIAYAAMESGGVTKYTYSTALVTGWNNLVITWIYGGDFKFYTNSVLTDTEPNANTPVGTKASNFYVGSDQGGNASLNTYLDDFVILDRVLGQDEIDQIYGSNLPMNVATRHFGLLMSSPDKGSIIGNAEGIYGYNADGDLGFELNNDGKIVGGGGGVVINEEGITVPAATEDPTVTTKAFRVASDVNFYGAMYGIADGGGAEILIYANDHVGTPGLSTAKSKLWVKSGIYFGGLSLIVEAGGDVWLELPSPVDGMSIGYTAGQQPDPNYLLDVNGSIHSQQAVVASIDGSSGGFYGGNTSDVHLYRIAANRWHTPDYMGVSMGLRVGDSSAPTNDDIRAAADISAGGGLYSGSVNGEPATGNVHYTGKLISRPASVDYTVYAFKPLPTPISSTNFYGAGKGNTTGGMYTASTEFSGVPSNAVALAVTASCLHSTANNWLNVGISSGQAWNFEVTVQVANVYNSNNGMVPLISGQFYLKTSVMFTNFWFRCVGYYI